MTKISKLLLKVLTNSVVISLITLLIGALSIEGSIFRNIFGFVGIYGTIITIHIFFAHLFFAILAFIFKEK